MKNKQTAAIILAAGRGTRMKSRMAKALHPIAGKPLVKHAVDNIKAAGFARLFVVVGHQGEDVQAAVPDAICVWQNEQLGTGHAVNQCRTALADFTGTVLVSCVDTPLLRPETLKDATAEHIAQGVSATVITACMADPTGYGRIIRGANGDIIDIIEEKDADQQVRRIKEINTGTYLFDSQTLFAYLEKITPENAQGEYYLPDVLPLILENKGKVAAYRLSDPEESLGINDRAQLAEAEKVLRDRIRRRLMKDGVTMIDPQSVYVDADCVIGSDTVILPNTLIQGRSVIGENCRLGPNTRIDQSRLGDWVQVENAVIVQSEVGAGTTVGPFAYLRPGTSIGQNCKIGDFVEVKNSRVADQSKVPHLSYVGDADVGSGVNIGCGTITCNYDGQNKYRTIIEDNVFVGSNSNLVAPVTLKKGAYIAAGSTITDQVPEDSLAIARARQINKEGWKKRRDNSDS